MTSHDKQYSSRDSCLAAIDRLQRAEVDLLMFRGDALVTPVSAVRAVRAVLPGAFNPLHQGHREMARVAQQLLGAPTAFELSIENVDKPPLAAAAIVERLAQFSTRQTVCLTRAATFLQKVQLLGRVEFVVGADTILRIADARYYASDEVKRDAAIAQLADRGARFLVFGRAISGRFRSLSGLELPERLRAICREVCEKEFRLDVSSTGMRRASPPGDR